MVEGGIYLFRLSHVVFTVTQFHSIQFLGETAMTADAVVELLLNQNYIISMFALCAVLRLL